MTGYTVSGGEGVASPLQYSGSYTDAYTGLIYDQARWYDPSTGQFLSQDPLVDQTGQPYAYGSDSPISEDDPTGLAPKVFICQTTAEDWGHWILGRRFFLFLGRADTSCDTAMYNIEIQVTVWHWEEYFGTWLWARLPEWEWPTCSYKHVKRDQEVSCPKERQKHVWWHWDQGHWQSYYFTLFWHRAVNDYPLRTCAIVNGTSRAGWAISPWFSNVPAQDPVYPRGEKKVRKSHRPPPANWGGPMACWH